ncbi:hypothetical protein DL769_003665 [Monosporascus sp. CRB-8-3]|nr:hypothetical protein DL769_003665 [Monosporascus sp. CRB-8-3]
MAEPIIIDLSDEDGSKRVVDELRTHFSTVRGWEFETLLQEGTYGVVVRIKKKPDLFVGVRRLAVKRALGENEQNQLRNEIKSLKKLRGAEHIVKIVAARNDINSTENNERNGLERNDGGPETNIARRGKSRLKVRFARFMRLFKKRADHYLAGLNGPVIVMEYLENGTFGRLMARAKRHDIHLPNLMLWSLFLCLVRACVAMAYPIEAPEGEPNRLETIPKDGRQPSDLYHGDLHVGNLMLGDPGGSFQEHRIVPVAKFIDFGSTRLLNLIARGDVPVLRCKSIYKGIQPMATEILPTENGDKYPMLDEELRDLLARSLAIQPDNRPGLQEMVQTTERADYGDTARYYLERRPGSRHTRRPGQRESYSDDEVEYGEAGFRVTRDSRRDKSYTKSPTIRLHNPSPPRSRSRNKDRPVVEHADNHKFGPFRVASTPTRQHYVGRDNSDATRGRLSPFTANSFYGGAKKIPPVPEGLRRAVEISSGSHSVEPEIEDLRGLHMPMEHRKFQRSHRQVTEPKYSPRKPTGDTCIELPRISRSGRETTVPEDLRTHSWTPSTLSGAEQEAPRATQSNRSGSDKTETGISMGRTPSFRSSMTPTLPSRASTGSIPIYSSNATFQYRSVQGVEFRLIYLLPENMSMIKCEIIHASLESHPEYVALSYAWGDVDDTTKIQIDGCPFTVTSSLHAALIALRKEHGAMILWADALCIDQNNKEEQSRQVQLMTRIYSQASSVAVWLGPEKENSALAVDLLRRVSSVGCDSKAMKNLVEDESIRHQFAALVALFGRDYFSRLWVVQEVLNAKSVTVYCGNNILAWSVYVDASKAFQLHKKYLRRTFRGGLNYGKDLLISQQRLSYSSVLSSLGPASLESVRPWRNKGPESLLEVLNICRRKLAGEPRDKVFGVLGILPEDVRYYFPPNYNESLREVYTNVVDFLLHTTRCFDVVCAAIYFPLYKSNANLPSWVPDWSHAPQTGPLALSYDFSAAGTTEAEFRFVNPPRRTKLEISAIELDRVACRGIAVGTLCGLDDSLMAFLHWRAKFLERGRISDEAFCRTLCLGQSREWRSDQRPDEWTNSSSGTLT